MANNTATIRRLQTLPDLTPDPQKANAGRAHSPAQSIVVDRHGVVIADLTTLTHAPRSDVLSDTDPADPRPTRGPQQEGRACSSEPNRGPSSTEPRPSRSRVDAGCMPCAVTITMTARDATRRSAADTGGEGVIV